MCQWASLQVAQKGWGCCSESSGTPGYGYFGGKMRVCLEIMFKIGCACRFFSTLTEQPSITSSSSSVHTRCVQPPSRPTHLFFLLLLASCCCLRLKLKSTAVLQHRYQTPVNMQISQSPGFTFLTSHSHLHILICNGMQITQSTSEINVLHKR